MLNFAINTAREAGLILLEKFGRVLKTTDKGDKNIVTEADLASEEFIVNQIKTYYPRHAILAEEAGAVIVEGGASSEYRWVIDPLDGTTNFSHGYPCFCVSIGLEKIGGEVVLGAVYDPTRDEMFAAERGRGATLNDRRIRVSTVESLDRSLLVTGFPYDVRKRERFVELFGRFVLNAQAVRRDGSAAIDLAYVACGRFEGFWEEYRSTSATIGQIQNNSYPQNHDARPASGSISIGGLREWDAAAGIVIVREAGGVVTDHRGNDLTMRSSDTYLVASNGKIHQEFLNIMNNA